MAKLISNLAQPPGRNYVSYLRRNADEFFWNTVSEQFEALNLGAASVEVKTPFRVSFLESVATPGNYSWELDVDTFIDGTYTYVSREVVGDAEYPDEQVRAVTIANGIVSGTELSAELIYSLNRTIFSFLRRNSDGTYYDSESESFELFNVVTAPEESRASKRVVFVEDPAGTYKWCVDASGFADGAYTLSTRELSAGLESLVAADYTVTVSKGSVIEGAILGEVALTQDTGGESNLSYVSPAGEAIEGASIRVYTQEDWASGNHSVVQGVSFTDYRGGWQTPVFVDTGRTYVVVFAKPGHFGPDTETIVL